MLSKDRSEAQETSGFNDIIFVIDKKYLK